MTTNTAKNKLRPLKQFYFDENFKGMNRVSTELADILQWYQRKLIELRRVHEKMYDMMDDYVTFGKTFEEKQKDNTKGLSILRQLQKLIEQNRTLEARNKKLEDAIKQFEEKFDNIFLVDSTIPL